jgi:hypothetical protein
MLFFAKFTLSKHMQHNRTPGPFSERGTTVICTGFLPFSLALFTTNPSSPSNMLIFYVDELLPPKPKPQVF